MILGLKFRELCESAMEHVGPGKLPRIRVISWEDYSEQIQSGDAVYFPAPLTEAQQIAYWDGIVSMAVTNDAGEYLVVLAGGEEGAA